MAQAEIGRVIVRFLIARRILLRSSYDLSYFLGSTGTRAETLKALSLALVGKLALRHTSRAEIARGYGSDWSWMRWLMDRSVLERLESERSVTGDNSNDSQDSSAIEAAAVAAVMSLGRFCTEPSTRAPALESFV